MDLLFDSMRQACDGRILHHGKLSGPLNSKQDRSTTGDEPHTPMTTGQKFTKHTEKFDVINTQRLRVIYMLLMMTIPLGLAWRMVPLGLSPFIFKYGGSMLWAAALYWFLAACLPRLGSLAVAWMAAASAVSLEFSRRWHPATIDAFRVSLAGRILLGRYFSLRNIVAYLLAIALVALIDEMLLRRVMAHRSASR